MSPNSQTLNLSARPDRAKSLRSEQFAPCFSVGLHHNKFHLDNCKKISVALAAGSNRWYRWKKKKIIKRNCSLTQEGDFSAQWQGIQIALPSQDARLHIKREGGETCSPLALYLPFTQPGISSLHHTQEGEKQMPFSLHADAERHTRLVCGVPMQGDICAGVCVS